jgi:hypothetical protein
MKIDYSHLPKDKRYDVFRNTDFSRVVEDKLSALVIKGEKKCVIAFHPVADNPDAVSFSCFDPTTKSSYTGTPEAGKFLLTKKAYDDFRNRHSNSDDVKRDLRRIDEFLHEVKAATKRSGA